MTNPVVIRQKEIVITDFNETHVYVKMEGESEEQGLPRIIFEDFEPLKRGFCALYRVLEDHGGRFMDVV